MSIILDALRKAETERSRQGSGLAMLGPDLAPAKGSPYKVAAAVFAGLVVGIAIALLGIAFLIRAHPGKQPTHSVHRITAPPKSPGLSSPRAQVLHPAVTPPKHPPSTVVTTLPAARPPPVSQHLPASTDWQIQVFSWTPRRDDRYVVINMRLYRAGNHLPGGARLLAIQSNGLLVEYQGHRYFVPRP